jgi:hypothetical protein
LNLVLQIDDIVPAEAAISEFLLTADSFTVSGRYMPGKIVIDKNDYETIQRAQGKISLSFCYFKDFSDLSSKTDYTLPLKIEHLNQRYTVVEIKGLKRRHNPFRYTVISPIGSTVYDPR